MSDERFKGDPYVELELAYDSTNTQIKRRWRELAREHHPDRAAGDREEAARLTTRMARINAAYDLLRDSVRRAAYDSSPAGRRARAKAGFADADRVEFDDAAPGGGPFGPPPPPRTKPVTARFDTSTAFHARNATITEPVRPLSGHPPPSRRGPEERDLRASTPTGPIERLRGKRGIPIPTLSEARETVLNFGKYHGYTLGEVELLDPAYIDWIARTITRDREMVIRARLIEAELDERGVGRPSRAAAAEPDARTAAG